MASRPRWPFDTNEHDLWQTPEVALDTLVRIVNFEAHGEVSLWDCFPEPTPMLLGRLSAMLSDLTGLEARTITDDFFSLDQTQCSARDVVIVWWNTW